MMMMRSLKMTLTMPVSLMTNRETGNESKSMDYTAVTQIII